MEILWKIVNFIILFGALYLVCRKMNLFDKMFGSRRRGIGDEIESSEKAKAQAKALGADIDKVRAENEERKQQLLKDAEAQAKADGEAIAASGEEEAKSILANAEKSEDQLMAQMRDRVSSDAVRRVAEITAEVLRSGSFENSKQALNDKFIEQIKELVSAMPSDILNMNELKKLDISIKSAQPLSDDEMKKLTQIICETFISCHNEVDTDVIGGVRMQVGDTVYDGTLAHTLDRLSQDVEDNTRQSDSQMRSIADGIKQQLEKVNGDIDVFQTGTVLTLGDGICRVSGLADVMAGEMLEFPGGLKGMVQDLDKNNVGVVSVRSAICRRATASVAPAVSSRYLSVKPLSAAWSMLWAARSTARVPSRPTPSARSRVRLRASFRDGRYPCQCRPDSRPSMRSFLSAAASVSSSSATVRPARPQLRLTPSSIRRARTLSASTSPSARRNRPLPAS